eukprot:Rhum_TRINITY_DN19818_c0_g1::Rhum_TRINITY_DN19818_c0_g1_i1::g.170663::m.170663
MPTSWKVEQANNALAMINFDRAACDYAIPAQYCSGDVQVVRVKELLASAPDAKWTARAAVRAVLSLDVPVHLVAWQCHWLLAHAPHEQVTEENLRRSGAWVEVPQGTDAETMEEADVVRGGDGEPLVSPFAAKRVRQGGSTPQRLDFDGAEAAAALAAAAADEERQPAAAAAARTAG